MPENEAMSYRTVIPTGILFGDVAGESMEFFATIHLPEGAEINELRAYLTDNDATEDINSGQSLWVGEHLNRFYTGLIDDVKDNNIIEVHII